MSIDLSNLKMKRICIHQIYEMNEEREIVTPKYNNELTKLNNEGIDTLQDRIINALGGESHSIQMDIDDNSENGTFQIMVNMLECEDNEFIEKSKKIALKLAQSQNSRKIPGGIVVVFSGTVGCNNKAVVGVIKAEIHSGFTIEDKTNSIILEYLSKLLLTPQQKLYKIAVFIEDNQNDSKEGLRNTDDFTTFIYDHNMNQSETKEAATYFYQSFLGCKIHHSNKKLTRDFYDDTREFINQLGVPDEQKVDMNTALYTYLKVSNETNISIHDFSKQYLKQNQRDAYEDFMETKEFPNSAIVKDLTYLKRRLKIRKIKFSSNVSVTAPSENFKDLVEISGHENGKTILKVQGHIKEQQ